MFGIPWVLIKWGGGALAILVVLGGLWLHGYSTGKNSVINRLKDDRITILQDGKAIDNEVDLADDTGLCALLGSCSVRDDADSE